MGQVVFWPMGVRKIQASAHRGEIAAGGRREAEWAQSRGVCHPETRGSGFSRWQWASLESFKLRIKWGWVE